MTEPSSPMLAIAILTRNRWAVVERCLASLYQQASELDVPIHLLVNGSADDTAERARRAYPKIHLHVSNTNLGCPGGRNHLMDLVEAEWVVHVDDDGTVGPGFIQAVQDEIDVAPADRAVVTGWIVDVDVDPDPALTSAVRHRFSGGIAALRRSTFLDLGGYPTDAHRQGEESDYAIRLHHEGHHIWQSASIVLFHPLTHSREKLLDILRTGLRHSVLTAVRYCPIWAMAPWVAWKMASFLVLAVKLRAPGPYMAGIRDAVRLIPAAARNRQPVSLHTLLVTTTRFGRGQK